MSEKDKIYPRNTSELTKFLRDSLKVLGKGRTEREVYDELAKNYKERVKSGELPKHEEFAVEMYYMGRKDDEELKQKWPSLWKDNANV